MDDPALGRGKLRAALGPLAWGRAPWEDLLALAIAEGLLAGFLAWREELAGGPPTSDERAHLRLERSDMSKAAEGTKHAFDGLTGRAPTNRRPLAWATLEISPRRWIPGLEPHEIFERLDAMMREHCPEAAALGPLPGSSYRQPWGGGDGADLASQASHALAIIEARELGSGLAAQGSGSKSGSL